MKAVKQEDLNSLQPKKVRAVNQIFRKLKI